LNDKRLSVIDMGQSQQGLKQQVTEKVKGGGDKKGFKSASGKRERLAEALRANLHRRKAQAEARKAGGEGAASAITSPQSVTTKTPDE
jgi:hypothetical protein